MRAYKLSFSTGKGLIIRASRRHVNMDQRHGCLKQVYSRKGAKAQSKTAKETPILCELFLCVFAPLREILS